MKKFVLIGAFLVATVCSGSAGAAEISGASLNALLKFSGIHDLVAQFPGMLRMRMAQMRSRNRFAPGQLPDNEYRALEMTVLDAFKPAGILQSIGAEVKKSVSEADAQRMLAWYNSGLGRKISRAEQDSSAPDVSSHALLKNKPLVIFAMKLDKLLHMTDVSMRFQIDAATAVSAALSTEKTGHGPDLSVLKQHIAAGMQKQRYLIMRSVITSTVFTYRQIDTRDLAQYRAFLESPASLRFNKALMAGMDEGLEKATEQMVGKVEHMAAKGPLHRI